MHKAFLWLLSHWHKVLTTGIIAIIIFRLIPFDRNWSLFWTLALVGIGTALLSRYDKTPNKIFTPKNGVRVGGLIIACMIVFGFYLRKTGNALSEKAEKVDDKLENVTHSASLDKLSALSFSSKDNAELERVMALPRNEVQIDVAIDSPTAVSMQLDRWSGLIVTPAGSTWGFPPAHKDHWIWFLGDKKPVFIKAGSNPHFENKRAIFRLLGDETIAISASSP